MLKTLFYYSWGVGFPMQAESDSPLSFAGWGWDSQHRWLRRRGGVACTWANPDDGMFKNSGMPSWGAGLGRIGGGESSSVWHRLLSLMLWIKVPVLPVKNEITVTGGRLSELLIVCHVFTTLVVCLNCDRRLPKQIHAGALCFWPVILIHCDLYERTQ